MLLHYVVVYDTNRGEFEFDAETTAAKFQDGPVYDPDEDVWRHLEEHEVGFDQRIYGLLGRRLEGGK